MRTRAVSNIYVNPRKVHPRVPNFLVSCSTCMWKIIIKLNVAFGVASLAFADDIVSIFYPKQFAKISRIMKETERLFSGWDLGINWDKTFVFPTRRHVKVNEELEFSNEIKYLGHQMSVRKGIEKAGGLGCHSERMDALKKSG
jgi:hypothetical protein